MSRPKDLPPRDRASMLQGVLHPGQQAEVDLWGCQAGLQVGWRGVAQHWNRKWAASDRKVHTTATRWRWRLLDWPPPQPAALQGRNQQPGLPLSVLLAGWKQGQVQVFFPFFYIYTTLYSRNNPPWMCRKKFSAVIENRYLVTQHTKNRNISGNSLRQLWQSNWFRWCVHVGVLDYLQHFENGTFKWVCGIM